MSRTVFSVALALADALGGSAALAQSSPQPPEAPASAAAPAAAAASSPANARVNQLDTVVVHGIKRGEIILPTTVNSASAYGLDLGVLDTPRNNTVLSRAQLEALNVQTPQQFSYLTSSSYADASFGLPNVPRIRGQTGDVFFNGMRDSFTANGYGAPLSFNSIDTLDIVKGPASVQAGPGAGVGGAINIATKSPNFHAFTGSVSAEFDTIGHRRASLDLGGPVSPDLAYRLSYTGEDSGSYYDAQYFHQQALYGAVVANLSDKYTVQFNSEISLGRYTENDGVNRVNQQLIDHGQYLTGGAVGPVQGFLTPVSLGNPVTLGDKVNIDEAPGTGARSTRYNAQLIQTYTFNENTSVVNNTFFNYLDRYNEVEYYFADSAKNSYTIENKTDFKLKFDTALGEQGASLSHSIDTGFALRYAHVYEVQNFLNEPVSTYDLTGDPNSWVFPSSLEAGGGGIPYTAPFGHTQYGVAARNPFALNASIVSNLSDVAAFLEHRIQVSPKLSLLYGLRGDGVHLAESDPLDDPNSQGYPRSQSTAWYFLGNANTSAVYKPEPWFSTYLTYNYAQYVNPNSNDGGVGTFGVADASVLRQNTRLLEGGVKLDLLDKSLFVAGSVFKQDRSIPTGPGNTESSLAHIIGIETELNYQPDPHFFLTASYSYIRTKLDTPASFYNFPAEAGLNVDGSGSLAVFAPGQKFDDPGVPKQLFNILVNYKDASGVGVQGGLQVTGPIETTTSGQLDLAASAANGATVPASIIANGGYYKSPVIPWQYTANISAFYDFLARYQVRFSIYNLTDRHNLVNDYPFYGNDFLTRATPRSFALSLRAKF